MPVKGVTEAKRNTRRMIGKIEGELSESTLTDVLRIAQGYATLITPVDTANLRNSQYRDIRPIGNGLRGRVGYTASYAAAVHAAPGTLKGEPRPNGNGNYWDDEGEPGFLDKAFVEARSDIKAAIRRGMKV